MSTVQFGEHVLGVLSGMYIVGLKLLVIMIRRSTFRLKWQPRFREFKFQRGSRKFTHQRRGVGPPPARRASTSKEEIDRTESNAGLPELSPVENLLSFGQGGPVISQRALGLLGAGFLAIGAVWAFQKPFRVYPSMEGYDNIALPPDWQSKTEWTQARLMYPQHPDARFARFRYGRLDWREGGTSWTQDYPRADRHFATRAQAPHPRSTCASPNSRRVPMISTISSTGPGWSPVRWAIGSSPTPRPRPSANTCSAAASSTWTISGDRRNTAASPRACRASFPTARSWISTTPTRIFHVVYDLDDRYQVPGMWALRGGRGGWMGQRAAGTKAHWMGSLRRPQPPDGGHVLQQRRRRFLGVGRRAHLPRKISRPSESASASTTSSTR